MLQTSKIVRIQYLPEIMKMGLTANIPLSELEVFKTKALETFWDRFPGMYEGAYGKAMNIGKHGSAKNVIIEDPEGKIINSTQELMTHAAKVSGVYVRFTKKPTE